MSDRNILIAFILNLCFSIFEIIGGIITNSVSIMSDAIHDFGDALSVGISLLLEKVSKKKPDDNYTYGYVRYSILGALITTIILTIGSVMVIISGINRIFNPVLINYNGMIVFSIFGVVINALAVYFTHGGLTMNQKAVNLHMFEDVLGWIIVLIGSILMKYTDIRIIDSLMSVGLALFILVNAFKNLREILDLFLEKTPRNINLEELKKHIMDIDGVDNVHHMHVWSIDGVNNYATMHVVISKDDVVKIKKKIREKMIELEIVHTTIEVDENLECDSLECGIIIDNNNHHH